MALYGALDKLKHFSEFTDPAEVDGVLKTAAERQALARGNLGAASSQDLNNTAGAGITGGTGTVYKQGVELVGDIIVTRILLDLTGLDSVATDGDIIGTGASAANLGQLSSAINGTIFGGKLTCLEAPATGEVDIDIYSADEATGVLDDAISGLSNTAKVIDAGADWTLGLEKYVTAIPSSDQYLYATVGTASTPTAGTYTAGKYLLELYGY